MITQQGLLLFYRNLYCKTCRSKHRHQVFQHGNIGVRLQVTQICIRTFRDGTCDTKESYTLTLEAWNALLSLE